MTLAVTSALSYAVRQRIEQDVDDLPIEVATAFGQTLRLIDEDGRWSDDIRYEHVGYGSKRIPWREQLHADNYIEWMLRAWAIDRMQLRLDNRPIIEVFQKISLLESEENSPEGIEEAIYAWALELVHHGASVDNQSLATGVRLLYRWCLEEDLPGFSEFRLFDLDSISIQRRSSEHLVSMRDVRQGPFTRVELERIEKAMTRDQSVTKRQKAIYYLGRDWGIRPIQIALLRPPDFGQDEIGPFIMVPSVKGIRRSRLRRAAGNFVKRYLEDDTAEAVETQIQSAETETKATWDRCLELAESLLGISLTKVVPIFPSFARTDDRIVRFISNPALQEYVLHTDSGSISRELIRLTTQLSLPNGRAVGVGEAQEMLEISAYRLRRTKGTSMVLSGATPEEVAVALDHESASTIVHYFRYNADLHEFINAVHDASPEIGEAVRLWEGRFVDEDSASIGDLPIGKIGKCGLGKPCPHQPLVTCYSCPSFRPYKSADHAAALEQILAFKTYVAERSTGPISQHVDAAIWGAKAILKIVEKDASAEIGNNL